MKKTLLALLICQSFSIANLHAAEVKDNVLSVTFPTSADSYIIGDRELYTAGAFATYHELQEIYGMPSDVKLSKDMAIFNQESPFLVDGEYTFSGKDMQYCKITHHQNYKILASNPNFIQVAGDIVATPALELKSTKTACPDLQNPALLRLSSGGVVVKHATELANV